MTTISTYRQSMNQINQFKTMQASMADLQRQLSTGKKYTLFKELDGDVLLSQRAHSTMTTLETYRSNILTGQRRTELMNTALEALNTDAESLADTLILQVQEGEINMNEIFSLADGLYDSMVGLLNEKDGDRYLFSGAKTQEKPIDDTGTHYTYIQSHINDWINGTIDSDELISSYRDSSQLTDTTIGYSTTLSTDSAKNVYIRVDDHTELDYTVLADDPAFRDVLVAVNMIRGLSDTLDKVSLDDDDPATTVTAPGVDSDAQSSNFYAVFKDVSKMLASALDGVQDHQQNLARVQVRMNMADESHLAEINTLQSTVDNIEVADMNEVAVAISQIQFQMEAAYRVTASLSQISLVNYI